EKNIRILARRPTHLVKPLQQIWRNCEVEGGKVVIELLQLSCANDGRRHARTIRHPVQCHLCRGTSNLLRDCNQFFCDLPVFRILCPSDERWVFLCPQRLQPALPFDNTLSGSISP